MVCAAGCWEWMHQICAGREKIRDAERYDVVLSAAQGQAMRAWTGTCRTLWAGTGQYQVRAGTSASGMDGASFASGLSGVRRPVGWTGLIATV